MSHHCRRLGWFGRYWTEKWKGTFYINIKMRTMVITFFFHPWPQFSFWCLFRKKKRRDRGGRKCHKSLSSSKMNTHHGLPYIMCRLDRTWREEYKGRGEPVLSFCLRLIHNIDTSSHTPIRGRVGLGTGVTGEPFIIKRKCAFILSSFYLQRKGGYWWPAGDGIDSIVSRPVREKRFAMIHLFFGYKLLRRG